MGWLDVGSQPYIIFPTYTFWSRSHHSMQIWIGPLNKSEIISAINTLNGSKSPDLGRLHAEQFLATSAVSENFRLPLIHRSWKSEFLVKEWEREIIVRIPEKGLKCNYWRSISVFSAAMEMISKMILEPIKEHLKSLMDRTNLHHFLTCFPSISRSFPTEPTCHFMLLWLGEVRG